MNVLAVNVKTLYRRRISWLWGILCLLCSILLSLILAYSSIDDFVSYKWMLASWLVYFWLMTSLYTGQGAANVQIEILTKPFSFCLPGHKGIVRRFIFLTGGIFSLLFTLPFLLCPGLTFLKGLTFIISIFFATMTNYILGALGSLEGKRKGLLLTLPYFLFLFWALSNFERILKQPLFYSLSVIVLGILVCVSVWRYLGRESLARQYCAAKKAQRSGRWEWIKLSPEVERFFIRRISRGSYSGIGRYIWGALYKTLGLSLSKWKWCVFFVLLATIVLGWIDLYFANLLFLCLGFAAFMVRLPVRSSMLVSGGRKERYYGAVGCAVATAILVSGMAITIVVLSEVLSQVVPDIRWKSEVIAFDAVDIRSLYWALLVIPLIFIAELFYSVEPLLTSIVVVGLSGLLFFTLFGTGILLRPPHPAVLILVVCSWGALLLVLRHIFKNWCLVRQRKE